jgi:peptide subunit release factor 1 (eRF1)
VATTVLNPTFKDVQWLADRPRGEGMVVSCYADMSVSSGVRPLWHEHLKNEVNRIVETRAADSVERTVFLQNVAAVEGALSSRRIAGARGMAVFAAAHQDLVHAYALSVPLPNRLVVDEEPYLLPLLEMLNRQRRYLVVHTDMHRGCLYTAVAGRVQLIEAINENVPKRQRSSGELWGKEQATIDRHRADHVLHYFKELAREVERAWPDERYDGIVLLGTHEVLEQFRTHLPDWVARCVVGEAPHAWVGKQASIEAKVDAIRDQALREHDLRLLDEIKRKLLEQHQIAVGPQDVIDALRNSQVGFPGRIVMEPDRGDVGWRCAGCTSLFAHPVDECPFCQTPCERTNLRQAIAVLAMRHNIPVHVVAAGQGLEKHGGIAALLARDEPWTGGSYGHSQSDRSHLTV